MQKSHREKRMFSGGACVVSAVLDRMERRRGVWWTTRDENLRRMRWLRQEDGAGSHAFFEGVCSCGGVVSAHVCAIGALMRRRVCFDAVLCHIVRVLVRHRGDCAQ